MAPVVLFHSKATNEALQPRDLERMDLFGLTEESGEWAQGLIERLKPVGRNYKYERLRFPVEFTKLPSFTTDSIQRIPN